MFIINQFHLLIILDRQMFKTLKEIFFRASYVLCLVAEAEKAVWLI